MYTAEIILLLSVRHRDCICLQSLENPSTLLGDIIWTIITMCSYIICKCSMTLKYNTSLETMLFKPSEEVTKLETTSYRRTENRGTLNM